MDDAFALAAVDLGGRPYWVVKAKLPNVAIGGYPLPMASQTLYGRVNLYVYRRGRELLAAGVVPVEDMGPRCKIPRHARNDIRPIRA